MIGQMPVRATKRGAERTPLEQRDCDVLVCGASFAGLAVARELAGSGAKVLLLDRYELGERQTSACAMPTGWLDALDLGGRCCQSFDELVAHTPFRTSHWSLPWSVLDVRLPRAVRAALGPGRGERDRIRELEIATVTGRDGFTVHTDRGDAARAADRRRARLAARAVERGSRSSPRTPRCRAVSRSTPPGPARRWSCGSTTATSAPATPGAFPRAMSCASASARSGPPTTSRSRPSGSPATWACRPTAIRATGSPTSCARPSRTRCSSPATPPVTACRLTAEGIRTALYFGLACGRELRAVLDGRATRAQALARYGAFSAAHERKYDWLLQTPARDRPHDALAGGHRARARVREPADLPLGVRALPGDRAAVVRGSGGRPLRASNPPSKRVAVAAST